MRWLCILGLGFLCGCQAYHPKPVLPATIVNKQIMTAVTSPTLLTAYNALPEATDVDRTKKVEARNQILNNFVLLIDQNYTNFEASFYAGQSALGFGSDVANIALTSVAAVTGSAHLKSVLAVIAAGLTGVRTSYQKNFFNDENRIVIIQEMRALRANEMVVLEDAGHMKAGVIDYSLESGLNDLGDYYAAGTLVGALEAIMEQAGAQRVQSNIRRQQQRTTVHQQK